MLKNERVSHTIQPILSQLLTQCEPELYTITHQGEAVFVLLPWSLYMSFCSVLTAHRYTERSLTEVQTLKISEVARLFLSFHKLMNVFQSYTTISITKRNEPVGALIRFHYYTNLIDFLQSQHLSSLDPFLIDVSDTSNDVSNQERILSLTAFRNLSMQMPYLLAAEQQRRGGELPFIVTRQYQVQPSFIVLSWETWRKLLRLLPTATSSQADGELLHQLQMQVDAIDHNHKNESTSHIRSGCCN